MIPKGRSRVFSIRWRARARVVFLPDRPNGVPSYPAPRCPVAPPSAAPTRPAREMSGFWIRQVDANQYSITYLMYVKLNLSNPKPGHTIPRAGRVEAPGGAAGRGRARLGANRTIRPGNKSPPFPPSHRRNVASTSLQKHEQAKSYVNRRRNKISV